MEVFQRMSRHRRFTILGRICAVFLATWLCQLLDKTDGLVQISKNHQLYHVTPRKHAQLHFLNGQRMNSTDLVFWNGLGGLDERVYILSTPGSMEKRKAAFSGQNLKVELAYQEVKITYVEHNPDHPNMFPTKSRLDDEALESQEEDPNEQQLNAQDPDDNLEEKIREGFKYNDQEMSERLIFKRKNKYRGADGDTMESIGATLGSPGLLPVTPILSYDRRHLTINSGLLYRIQGVQTLIQGNVTTSPADGEWINSRKQGIKPRVGEYIFGSWEHERDGCNPLLTAEETSTWKNPEYKRNRTKGALWMFVPTEKEGFYEIRNRNYPASLLVWGYDKEEGESILFIETRRNYLRRYSRDGTLRYRALFALQRVSEKYQWELIVDERPKYWLYTYNQNHVYLYESTRRSCSLLIVRNSAERPYTPDKTDKMGRPLDMFYITRIDLTGDYTASLFSFLYERSIVDIFAQSMDQPGGVTTLRDFQMVNRGPENMTHYVFEEVKGKSDLTFQFQNSFKAFQWVTVEALIPSFGIAPLVLCGVLGKNTNTNSIHRSLVKEYEIQDKVVVDSGSWVNASVMFQRIENFENPFSAIMEVTEPADRLYIDKQGKPRFIRLSLPGNYVERTWDTKANFKYERVIERREAAFVVQVRGVLKGSYGLRAFVRRTDIDYSAGIVSCGEKEI